MEVHHHSHTSDPDSHRGRKKWTHYFWEFLMLFLAVTLGFFVENQREHFIENKREKQFMRSLLQDLKTDISIINTTIELHTESNKMIDTLIVLLKSPERNKSTGKIYTLAKTIPIYDRGLSGINKTYEQMKSSGNLRLIHNITLLDTIGYYYYFNELTKTGAPQMQFENRHDLFLYYNKLFDASVFQKMLQSPKEIIRMPDGNPPLMTNDPDIINEVCMRYHNMYFTKKALNHLAEDRKNLAILLIKKIEAEYHFE